MHGGRLPETLQDLLDRHRIVLNEMPRPNFNHGGARSRLYCPACNGGKHRERNFYVKIDPDMLGATWLCYRTIHCGIQGGGRVANAPRLVQRPPRQYRTPEPVTNPELPDSLVAYFATFGISEDTLRAFGIYRTERKMPAFDANGHEVKHRHVERPVIAYPYRDDGVLLNVKYKTIYERGGRKKFTQEWNCRPSLFNIDAFTDPEGVGIFVEGEDDVLALHEVGYRQVTTVVDGSPAKLAESYDPATDDDQRYAALLGEPRLERLEKIVLAGDKDPAGERHHEEIARRLGKHRCWVVHWPEGCKDAKDTLSKHGHEAVLHAIEQAEPYPLEGVEVINDQEVLDLQAGRTGKRYITGYKAIDDRVSLSDSGQLICTTGVPGHGKSIFWINVAVMYAERWAEENRDDLKLPPFHTVVFSGETVTPRVCLDLTAMHAYRPAFPHPVVPHVTPEEVTSEYLPWIRRHFSFIKWDDKANELPISWLMQRIRDIVQAKKAKLVIIDPWQELDDEMPDYERNISRHIGKILGRLRALAFELGTNIALVVHPTKRKRVDGKFLMPLGDDIADSRFFYTKAHIGLTLHRPDLKTDETLLHTWKAKDVLYAKTGETKLRFDSVTKRFWPIPGVVDALEDPAARAR